MLKQLTVGLGIVGLLAASVPKLQDMYESRLAEDAAIVDVYKDRLAEARKAGNVERVSFDGYLGETIRQSYGVSWRSPQGRAVIYDIACSGDNNHLLAGNVRVDCNDLAMNARVPAMQAGTLQLPIVDLRDGNE